MGKVVLRKKAPELIVATLLWDSRPGVKDFSRMYDESWVDKLYRGFVRNLTVPFAFLCYTDRPRKFESPGVRKVIDPMLGLRGYADCIIPYRLNKPMILCGLDTIVLKNIDHLASYVLEGGKFALPRDPYKPYQACNGVALVPAGMRAIHDEHDKITDDMTQVRKFPHVFLDDEFPGQIKSYKGHVKKKGWGGVHIVYFHGEEKPHQISHREQVVRDNWV